jgi:hypothetical protein
MSLITISWKQTFCESDCRLVGLEILCPPLSPCLEHPPLNRNISHPNPRHHLASPYNEVVLDLNRSPCHKDVCGSGGVASRILNFSTSRR